MDKKDYESLRIKFLKKFADIPDKIRSEDVLAIVEDKPYTWNNAALEIKNNSEVGRKIIKILKDLGVI